MPYKRLSWRRHYVLTTTFHYASPFICRRGRLLIAAPRELFDTLRLSLLLIFFFFFFSPPRRYAYADACLRYVATPLNTHVCYRSLRLPRFKGDVFRC